MRIAVVISGHGFGHLSQTAPVLRALRAGMPDIDIVVRTGLDPAAVSSSLGTDVPVAPEADEFGLEMLSPFEVDAPASLERYRDLHECFDEAVERRTEWLMGGDFDAVIANTSYLIPLAARQAGIRSCVFSSLTWAEVFGVYCGGLSGAAAMRDRMAEGYRAADLLIGLRPGTPMTGLGARFVDRPIATVGQRRRREILSRIGAELNAPLIVVALGGIGGAAPPPLLNDDIGAVIVPDAWRSQGRCVSASDVGLPFTDVLASADLAVSKAGYGAVCELGCLGTRSILVDRPDWPEQPALTAWLSRHASTRLVSGMDAVTGELVRSCLAQPAPPASQRARSGGEDDVSSLIRRAIER